MPSKVVCVDVETDGLHYGCNITDIAWRWSDGQHGVVAWDDKDDLRHLGMLFALADPTVTVICHNAKFDLRVLMDKGVRIRAQPICTQIMSQMLNPNDIDKPWKRTSHALKDLAQKRLGLPMAGYMRVNKWLRENGHPKGHIWKVPRHLRQPYNMDDVDATMMLAKILGKQLVERGMYGIFLMEMKLMRKVIMPIEHTGLRLNQVSAHLLRRAATRELAEVTDALRDSVGDPAFKPGSTQQVGRIVFCGDVRPSRWTKGRPGKGPQPAVDDLALTEVGTHFAKSILRYRNVKRAVDYVTTFEKHTTEGILRFGLNQTGACTGRMSSSSPNLQNLPRTKGKTKLHKMRGLIQSVVRGNFLLMVDYHQIELRLAAHFSGQDWMLDAFNDDRNLHEEAMMVYFGKTKAEEPTLYNVTKNLNFAMLYGVGTKKLQTMFAKQAGLYLSLVDCSRYRQTYKDKNPRIMGMFEKIMQEVVKTGGVRNPFGRFTPCLPGEAYKAVNYLIQGTAAEIIKLAMLKLADFLAPHQTRMAMVVHDEIIFEMPLDEVWLIPAIREHMEVREGWDAPITCSIEAGNTWGTKKPVPSTLLTSG